MINNNRFGWLENPSEVERVVKTLPTPFMTTLIADEKKEINLAKYFKSLVGEDAPKGPQGIGDCVSWAWGNFLNYLQITQLYEKLKEIDFSLFQKFIHDEENVYENDELARLKYEYQECATEATYALSRIEVGNQHNSYSDGSVGAWAAKAAEKFGFLSRPQLEIAGLPGKYDPKRAKEWGAKGLPDHLEPTAKNTVCKVVSKITTFLEAAAAIQNFQTVPVCSNRGFSMTRDNQGFCKPQGVWYHAMLFIGVRWDRPGLLCSQSWGKNTPNGPVQNVDQPDNTFWVDANVCDYMLKQGDSFTGNSVNNYVKRDWIDWSF
jgi:hypothetical protein